jgi:hypothetical protein
LLTIEALDELDLQKAVRELPPCVVKSEIGSRPYEATTYSLIFTLNRGFLVGDKRAAMSDLQ